MASTQSAIAGDVTVRNATALLPGEGLTKTDIWISGGRIERTGTPAPRGTALEGTGLMALPGIVDLHGDAFERMLMPRSGVRFPVAVALAEADRQLLANGITTAFHGITCSWEPGLRSRETVVDVMTTLDWLAPRLGCDTRIHLRHELHNTGVEDEIRGWIESGRVSLLALNDHLAMIHDRLDRAEKLSEYTERSGLDAAAYRALVADVAGREPDVAGVTERLCRAAVDRGLPIASHDDETPAMRAHYRGLGARICEFPCNAETAADAVAAGEHVVLGAPNILRGGSHDDRLKAGDAAERGLCSVLASDYYYPSVLQAAFRLARDEVLSFEQAWDLVSAGPARAAGISDRGQISPGQRADLLLVDPGTPAGPQVVATIAGGRVVHQHDPAGYLEPAEAV